MLGSHIPCKIAVHTWPHIRRLELRFTWTPCVLFCGVLSYKCILYFWGYSNIGRAFEVQIGVGNLEIILQIFQSLA